MDSMELMGIAHCDQFLCAKKRKHTQTYSISFGCSSIKLNDVADIKVHNIPFASVNISPKLKSLKVTRIWKQKCQRGTHKHTPYTARETRIERRRRDKQKNTTTIAIETETSNQNQCSASTFLIKVLSALVFPHRHGLLLCVRSFFFLSFVCSFVRFIAPRLHDDCVVFISLA